MKVLFSVLKVLKSTPISLDRVRRVVENSGLFEGGEIRKTGASGSGGFPRGKEEKPGESSQTSRQRRRRRVKGSPRLRELEKKITFDIGRIEKEEKKEELRFG